ncbi:MAG: hypothetical protein JXA21_30060 [Anaerolineae bacterium]|nr:hypothetical protein [Anaerolineae bacterium]
MNRFPAILIGGPPHSGKSVLTYSLTHALRERGVKHYVIRAAPDGEGDWSNEADQNLVRELRFKGEFTPAFTDFVCRSLRQRHYPVLVDAGGRPTPEQERIFDECTHAVLLTPNAQAQAHWRALCEQHALPIIADLTSQLQGNPHITAGAPILEGVITGLERRCTASGPVFEALVEKVAAVLSYDADELFRRIESACPVETVIDLQRLASTFNVPFEGQRPQWQPHHLSSLLNYLPAATSLGLYERGTNWIYAAVALLSLPADFYQFDPRLGWVPARTLHKGQAPGQAINVKEYSLPDGIHLEFEIPATLLDYAELPNLVVPELPPDRGVILGGKIPYWLYTSLARTYQSQPWIAVYQPQLTGAVVVHTTAPSYAIGDLLAI